MTFKPGDRVRVISPISEMEKSLIGRLFTVDRMDPTHGYAVCKDEHGAWHLHPEALMALPGDVVG